MGPSISGREEQSGAHQRFKGTHLRQQPEGVIMHEFGTGKRFPIAFRLRQASRSKMKSRLFAVLATFGLAAASVAAGATPANADVPCTITNFSPRVVNVGIAPVTATFGVTTADCVKEHWSVEGESFYVYPDSPQWTFAPYSNAQAGPEDVIVTADNSDFMQRERVFANGFILKRSSVWQTNSFNASPEPVRKGQKINIKARLLIGLEQRPVGRLLQPLDQCSVPHSYRFLHHDQDSNDPS
jgi:hypothetical protein